VPQSEINTLADILAACVNVTDATYEGANHNSSACSTLFGAATSDGTPSGTQPSDTATAAINIAQHPGANVGTLYDLATATAPFQPILSGSSGYDGPNDWTIAITYSGGSLHGPHGLAIDSAGYVWVANQARNCISQFNFNGVPGAEDGYDGNGSDPSGCGNETSGGGIAGPSFIAFDPTGQYIWIANYDTLAVLTFATGLGYENYLSDYTGNGGYTGVRPESGLGDCPGQQRERLDRQRGLQREQHQQVLSGRRVQQLYRRRPRRFHGHRFRFFRARLALQRQRQCFERVQSLQRHCG
jgi:DNA-binding beta-propeller fold protein YncE